MNSRPSQVMSRPVMLMWSSWLIGAVLICFGMHQPITFDMDSAIPAIRLLLILMIMGLQCVWPLWVLSLKDPAADEAPHRATLTEWVGINLLTQFTIWPLWTIPGWTVLRSVETSIIMFCWSLILAPIIVQGRTRGAVGRSMSMLLCLLLPFLIPVSISLVINPDFLWSFTPYAHVISLLNRLDYHFTLARHLPHMVLAGLSIITWIVMAILAKKHSQADDSVIY